MKKKDVKILIVEDEEDQRIRLKYVLEEEGYTVVESVDGDDALKRLAYCDSFNMVITDLKMPGKNDGEDVLIKTKKKYPKLPVIIVTAYGSIDSAVRSMKGGALDYIQKPLNIPELRVKVAKGIKKRARGSNG